MTRLNCGRHAVGPGVSPLLLGIALLTLLRSCTTLGSSHGSEGLLQDLPSYKVVHPIRVDARGHFLSNFLSHHARRVQRRETSEGRVDSDQVFYQLWHDGHRLNFNLTLNSHLLAPGFLTERRYGGLKGSQIRPPTFSRCHFFGEVRDGAAVKGNAAISTCDGLTGLFKLSEEEFFIQPLEESSGESSTPQAHAIYKRHTSPPGTRQVSGKPAPRGTCGIKNSVSIDDTERQRERWERRQGRRRRRIHQRSVSREKWVETLVVADPKMVEYHGGKAVEGYVLAVMNIVAGLFTDASIGNAINIVVVRLILLEQDEDELKISHHADNSLNSFCKWQKKLNMKGDDHPLHHDVAVLLTRKDICAAVNMPCETLGLSHVAGMCQPHRSCSISEDTGLPLAFTVAHELGHNFGIQHDGNGNDCEPVGKRPFVMSPQLLYGTFLPRWSRCSRQYITRFLDRGWGSCLDDAPGKDKLSLNLVLPGVLYTATHQCRLQYGSGSRLCNDVDNVCSTLWCTVGTTCHSKLDGAADGTSCGENKWCFSGECVSLGVFPESVHGGWGSWSDWTACSRTCGVSVRSAQRDCDNPTPRHRGKYCLGERRRYMICKMAPCPQDTPRFRDVQCGHFNNLPYKGKFYRWESVINKVSPCELHCRPLNEHFSEKMQDAVTDGTPCYEGNKSRDLCINGICKNIGCDYVIDSGAVEDRCGVCHGNGSTCTTVKKTFEESEGIGYVDIGLIPEGAREIRIEEVAEAGNFLALRSDHPGKYFLNGGWTIQWNGEYKAAGTVFTYLRVGHLENLTSPGPTVEPLWIQLLFQESNPGVRYEYTVSQTLSQDKNSTLSAFYWKHGSWSECSVTCGTGVQRQIVHCVEKTIGIVEEHFCDPETRPDDNQTSCNRDPCPAVWWVGEWHKCSVSCGDTGLAKRTVLCIQAISVEEQKALQPSECEHIPKPESIIPCNTGILCPAEWTSGAWSKCSVTCGSGLRRRDVSCSTKEDFDCDPQNKPPTTSTCQVQDCPVVVDNFGGTDWSGSGWPSKEVLNEINSIPEAKPLPKYSTTRAQPSTHNNLNDIVEGDFHFHNNIENGDQSKVHVDDFYYDYNFINFHEDLSADFDNDENDSGDSHGLSEEANKNENANIDIVGAPTTTPAISAAYMTNTEEPQNTNHVKVEHSGNTATNESVQRNSENLGDFLHEDLLLPVSTTHSPTSSTTGHSPKPKQIHEIVRWPENRSTLSPPESTTKEASQDVTWEQYLDETENSYRYFPEENSTDNVTLTPNHDAPTPIYHTIVSTIGASPVNTQEKGLSDVYDEYIYNDLSMSGQDVSVEGTERFVTPAGVQLEDTASEIPQSTLSTTTFKLDFSSVYEVNKGSPWGSDHHPSETSLTSTQKATPLTFPFPEISGNQETSDGSVLLTGTETIPLTNQKGASQSSSDDLPSEMEQVPARTSMNITTGTDSDSKPQLFDVNEFDFNEILLPPVVSSTSNSEPDLSASAVTTEPPMTPVKLIDPSAPAMLPQATPPSTLRTPSVSTTTPTSTPTRFKNAAYWVTGNWSACSTSCGLGAVWRTLTCSTGSDSDCDPAQRPVPAQRCYLRPCSTWKVGNWSKCSRNCEGGNKSREVQCIDLRDQRPLRPFHCQAVSSRPPTQMYCNIQPCLDWYTSSWGPCSEVCGGGEQQRIVTCLEKERCNSDLQPSTIQSCNSQPCAQWLTGSWGQCSASCGGGLQYRLIKCVNTKVEMEEEVDQASCAHDPKPASSLKCNLQECDTASTGAVCLRDRLTSRFCQTLFVLGRCRLANVRTQCCKTCSRLSRLSTTSRH